MKLLDLHTEINMLVEKKSLTSENNPVEHIGKNIPQDKSIPKSFFKNKLYTNKNGFWKTDKENVPLFTNKGGIICVDEDKISALSVAKAPSPAIYRAMPYASYLKFKDGVEKSKGIYLTTDIGDALGWCENFALDDSVGAGGRGWKLSPATPTFSVGSFLTRWPKQAARTT